MDSPHTARRDSPCARHAERTSRRLSRSARLRQRLARANPRCSLSGSRSRSATSAFHRQGDTLPEKHRW
jgi:hypothetical protein